MAYSYKGCIINIYTFNVLTIKNFLSIIYEKNKLDKEYTYYEKN